MPLSPCSSPSPPISFIVPEVQIPVELIIVQPEEPRPVMQAQEPPPEIARRMIAAPPPPGDTHKPLPAFNPETLAALLDKLPRDGEEEQPRPARLDERLSLSEIDKFKIQMRRCWTIPAGAPNAHKLIVRIRVFLDADGSLVTPPEILNSARGNVFLQIAIESALRAIQRCQPFKMPQEKYENWREITLIFNPTEMLGG